MAIVRMPVIFAISASLALAVGCFSNVPNIKEYWPTECGQYTVLEWAVAKSDASDGLSVKGLLRNNGPAVKNIGIYFDVLGGDEWTDELFMGVVRGNIKEMGSGTTSLFDAYIGFEDIPARASRSDMYISSVRLVGLSESPPNLVPPQAVILVGPNMSSKDSRHALLNFHITSPYRADGVGLFVGACRADEDTVN